MIGKGEWEDLVQSFFSKLQIAGSTGPYVPAFLTLLLFSSPSFFLFSSSLYIAPPPLWPEL